MSDSLFFTSRRAIPGQAQKLAYTSINACSAAIPQSAQSVTVFTSTVAFVKIGWGSTLVATTSDIPVPANVPVVLQVPQRGPNDAVGSDKILVAAIRDSVDGSAWVQPNAD